MSAVEIAKSLRAGFPAIDTGWPNIVFALKTAGAAILALAIAYWLELSDPQWATLTVYVLAQPTVGAAVAKGLWRAVGTVAGGVVGLVLVALFSQAPELLVSSVALLVGASFYAGARLRNYTSYGALLAGYTMLLVAYEGSANPLQAWSVAVDRTSAILIGIACGTLATVTILPRYAGDALREAQAGTFSAVVHYVATALRMSTPAAVFARLRGQMVAKVVSFDALCSSALFESPEMRANESYLRRSVREFLIVLSTARGLYVRLDELEKDGARPVYDQIRPTLEAIAARLEQIAADPHAWRQAGPLRSEFFAARATLAKAAAKIEDLAGAVPFDHLAGALLILSRVRDVLHGVAMLLVAGSASHDDHGKPIRRRRRETPDFQDRQEALLLAIRAGVAILLVSGFWMATGWNEGFTAVSGGAVMLFFGVNKDDPMAGARTYLIWSGIGIIVAYLAIAVVLPYLQGFGALAVVLPLVLLPAGLMAGTPSFAWAGIALGGWTVAEIGFGNVFRPDELAYINSAFALILGMIACLAVIAIMPVTSYARRGQSRSRAIGMILPAVARGRLIPRQGASQIVASLAALLPRLALERQREEEFFRGTLSLASSAIELGRLRDLRSDPRLPGSAAEIVEHFLEQFADALEKLAANRAGHRTRLDELDAIIAKARASLAAQPLGQQPAAAAVLHAGASMRFIADRFLIDRSYLEGRFVEG